MNQIQITIPNEPPENIESVIFLLTEDLKAKNIVRITGDNNTIIFLRSKTTDTRFVMEKLTKIGIGVDFGIIDIIPLNASLPSIASFDLKEEDKLKDELKGRISLEEIHSSIMDSSTIDLNFFIFLTIASLIAATGLLVNSSVVLIASMIISPFMGPILSVSYGVVIKDREFIRLGVKGQTYAVIIGILIGIIMGLISSLTTNSQVITDEMSIRTFPSIWDFIIGFCAGIAVGFCITGGTRGSLVGVAVAVALLPPAVNAGIALSWGELSLALGGFSLMLTNIFMINLCSIFIFKLRDIKSLPKTPKEWIGPVENIKKIKPIQNEPPAPLSFWERSKRSLNLRK